jgi:hypothetical protein
LPEQIGLSAVARRQVVASYECQVAAREIAMPNLKAALWQPLPPSPSGNASAFCHLLTAN